MNAARIRQLNSHCCCLMWDRCQNTQSYALTKTHTAGTHTHPRSYSCVLHLNAPWGAWVAPLSSIWETTRGPGEKEALGKYVTLTSRADEKSNINHANRSTGCFHTNIWGYCIMFHGILCWFTDKHSGVRYTPQQCFLSNRENYIFVMWKSADSADSRITRLEGVFTEFLDMSTCI